MSKNRAKKIIYVIPTPCENLKICKNIQINNESDFNTIPNKSLFKLWYKLSK